MQLRPRAALVLAAALAACTPAAARTPPIVPAPAPAPVVMPPPPSREAVLAASLDSIFGDTLFAGANWGVEIRTLQTGSVLYQRNAGKMFVPASNMKIVTAAAALETLGPDFVYRTPVVATGTIGNGVLRGDLVVVGSGDPTIAADFHRGDARAVFRAWADSLRARGVRRITGRIIGNDDVFDDVPLGRGWAWDDLADYYSAEVGGLQYNLGVVGITAAAGSAPGAAPRITLDPQTRYVRVTTTARTVAPGADDEIEVTRADTGNTFTVAGQIPADTGTVRNDMAVRNNTAYFVTVLRETLVERGIRVDGAALDHDALAPAARPVARDTLFVHRSPPMREILAGFMKPSQNQIGEILLKTMGRTLRGQGTARAGIAVVDSAMRAWGMPPRKLAQADGSGLSRYNLVAPVFLIGLLEHMRQSPNWQVFYDAMPVAGVDGTLRNRMRGTPLQGNVHAKTGTVSNVRSLSGYMTTQGGEPIVFSIIVNHHTLTSRDADRLAEAALGRVHALSRP
ncbi:MAG TPA: D-alanyl-D-alanine carboxypeptidase/D-alanyl-D-alanine-endopeptidase [Longimicrobium sp.]|jgi:D-alanyl-D-alanine carboxypeptidase/D-alanyl-D-alanine-endopeptidase (penicillin-binding protein 4)